MRRLILLLALAAALPTAAAAVSPQDAPRPEARGDGPAVRPADVERAVTAAVLGVRPAGVAVDRGGARAANLRPASALAVAVAPRPLLRPQNLVRRGRVAASGMRVTQRALDEGASLLCQSADIVGQRLQPIPGRLPGCGVDEPVRVLAVAGVRLSQPSVMDCPTAMALRYWVAGAAKPLVAETGRQLVGLKVAAHYACRTRNNRRGAKISEHGKGRAIDISGLRLSDGSEVSLLRGWGGRHGGLLRRLHGAACGPFGTVLGPEANRFHRDHFHFDTARYRSGSYCQ